VARLRSNRQTALTLLRLVAGLTLAWCVALAVIVPETPLPAKTGAVAVFAVGAWSAASALSVALVLMPAAALFASPPLRGAELIAWSFLSAWLLAVPLRSALRHSRSAAPPLAEEPAGSRALIGPALLYGACALASYVGLTLGGAAGINPSAMPGFLLQSIPAHYLVSAAIDTETWAFVQVASSVALFVAVVSISKATPAARRGVACATVVTGVVLALATIAAVVRQWALLGWAGGYVLRYVRGERFALHLSDVNAAGSYYVLSALIAIAFAAADKKHRWLWLSAVLLMVPALWLTGSRSAAMVSVLVAASAVHAARRGMRPSRRQLGIAGAAVGVLLVATLSARGWAGQERGSAGMSLRLRSQFLQTSVRMFGSAPIFGVGIGAYHRLSGAFMPDELREIYQHENAHNYFAQQFAELGLVGGSLFLWAVGAALKRGWHSAEASRAEGVSAGLFVGALGYLITCATGHPLLVAETALPFWVVLGASAAGGLSPSRDASVPRYGLIAAVIVVLMVGVTERGRAYFHPPNRPGWIGFFDNEIAPDGTRFNWITPHAIIYIGPQRGFLTIPLRAPDFVRRVRPWIVEVSVGGRVLARETIPADQWRSLTIRVRQPSTFPFNRVDLRVNHLWTPTRDFGPGTDDTPHSLMLGTIKFQPTVR
jgi:O-antigen ligase